MYDNLYLTRWLGSLPIMCGAIIAVCLAIFVINAVLNWILDRMF